MNKLILAITLMLSMNANAEESVNKTRSFICGCAMFLVAFVFCFGSTGCTSMSIEKPNQVVKSSKCKHPTLEQRLMKIKRNGEMQSMTGSDYNVSVLGANLFGGG